MCCTLGPAHLSKTILYAGEAIREGRTIHVLGYQNRAENRSPGPNAMILPFPAAASMGRDNVLDLRSAPTVLEEYTRVVAAKPATKSGRLEDMLLSLGAEVFDSGSYTIVLARDARAIPDAIDQVPEARRPLVTRAIFEAYAGWYPDWPIALCCFDGTMDAEPMLWWYEPVDPSRFFMPALDAHDGEPPVIGARVEVDHTLIWGSSIRPDGIRVHFRDPVPSQLRPFLADRVWGVDMHDQRLRNGDFVLSVDKLARNKVGSVQRLVPPGA